MSLIAFRHGLSSRWLIIAGVSVALLTGALLRLVWVTDMEYKLDEAWTFQRTQLVGHSEPFPWVGMPNGAGVRHPGGTVWIFLGLSRLFDATTPEQLARACQIMNVAALAMVVAFALFVVSRAEREIWLWAAAMAAVNPIAVVFHRKIWPPSAAPCFTMLTLASWWYRDRRIGALAWGVAGAILGQVHPAGIFFVAAFALWACLFERRNVRWRWWLLGVALASLPLLPWIWQVYVQPATATGPRHRWDSPFELRFWLLWVTESFGFGLEHSLGADYVDFMRYPVVLGRPTHMVAGLHVLLGFLAAWLLISAILRRGPARSWAAAAGQNSPTAFTQNACLVGFGVVFTATFLPVYRHYMLITFPLMFVWLARMALRHQRPIVGNLTAGRIGLMSLWSAQAILSATFLLYIHENPRSIRGDYGIPYRVQVRENTGYASGIPTIP